MIPWRTALVGLFYCCVRTAVTQSRTNGATRVKRGLTTAENPKLYSPLNDARLLFEILMAGVHFEPSGAFSVEDAELNSLQKTRTLDIIYEQIIPKNLMDVSRLIFGLSDHIGPLHQDDFEHTLLTLVYTTQKMVRSTSDKQRKLWGESFVALYRAIKKDLTQTN